ncbi:MAG: hypothetical protein U1D30_25065 [Planctomycetota bacterium]
MMSQLRRFAWMALLVVANGSMADDSFEQKPIEYSKGKPSNPISRLQEQLAKGAVSLNHDRRFGYLPALLEKLEVPTDSQMLVHSKTSLQRSRISPRTPRALYFNDEIYVGYCQSGEVIEISVADPGLGTVFYTLDQKQEAAPVFLRQTDKCLICHGSSQTDGVPGHLVRSVFVDEHGLPLLGEGSHRVDHTTPLEDRWGGWYVTGRHGEQKHLGNLIYRGGKVQRPIVNDAGLNVTMLDDHFSTERYLTPHSDIVALMVLEHQAMVHNLITKASFATREALHYELEFNRALGEPVGNRLPSTTSRIRNAGEKLVRGLLFVDEAKLTDSIVGTSTFTEQFSTRGPRDSKGRSLRDFDLTTRLFKFPCSYLIYSPAFDGLPDEAKAYVSSRLQEILTGTSREEAYAHLSDEDRQTIFGILRETKPDLLRD